MANLFSRTILTLSVISLSCCVTQNKYNRLLDEKLNTEAELSDKKESLSLAEDKLDRLNQKIEALVADTTDLGESTREQRKELAELKAEHSELEKYYNNLLNNSGKLSRDLAQQQESLYMLKENLEQEEKRNDILKADLEEREKKVKELEEILKNKENAVRSLKDKITNALLNFKESDLTVEEKNGKVYVSLAEQLLFKSGSIAVDPKGVGALQQLAKALQNQSNINIVVEGHTDDVPISKTSKYMNDNWDLSVMRATSIVRILTKAGVSTGQITAAGKGEFSPLTSNDTAESRKKNRRTEIIVTPDLGELLKILETN